MTESHVRITSDPDLIDVLDFLWRQKRFVFGGGLAGLALAALFVILAVPHYRASMIVGPAMDLSVPGVEALTGRYDEGFGPALSGRSQSGESADFVRFEKTLTGPAVAAVLFQDPKIREGLIHAHRFVFLSAPDVSTPEALSTVLTREVSIEFMGLSNLRKIVYSHPDPAFATYLVAAIHRAADGLIRADAAVHSAKRIAFLESEMNRVRHPDQIRALATLLTGQEQVAMMATIDEPYAASVIEPSSATSRPTWPRRPLVFAVFLIAGLGAGSIAAFLRDARRGR
ncbi:MAG: hypothetical protein H6862_01105 [Rhodospirillales bacterium]|nr:hypothetical protein [Rhodospirillales bacterium]